MSVFARSFINKASSVTSLFIKASIINIIAYIITSLKIISFCLSDRYLYKQVPVRDG